MVRNVRFQSDSVGEDQTETEYDTESDNELSRSVSEADMDISKQEEEEVAEEEIVVEEAVGNDNIEEETNQEDSDLEDTELQEMLQEATAPLPSFLDEDSEYPDNDPNTPLPPRRSGRTSRLPSRFREYEAHLILPEPKTYAQAIVVEE